MPLPLTDEKNDLLRTIEHLRGKMVCIGTKEGFTSKKTIMISQLLDRYITKYQLISGKH